MSASFMEDLEYLGKVLLFTFVFLSMLVIYNQKVVEGIILISFCCQFGLLWILIKDYWSSENIPTLKRLSSNENNRYINYLHLIITIFLFFFAIYFIFRAVAILQHSIINYGSIKTSFYSDIIIAAIIGFCAMVTFVILVLVGNKYLKENVTENKSNTGQLG